MQTILFVVSSLEPSGAARQLALLAAGLPRASFQVRVLVLGSESPCVASLRATGVEVETLGWRRPFDVRPLLALRRRVRSMRPDVIHVWGATALRAIVLTGASGTGRLLVSAALSLAHRPARLDQELLRRTAGVIAFGEAEVERYRRLGITDNRLTVVAPATSIAANSIKPAEFPGIAATARVILGLGPIERHKGFREAVWAFDILRHLYTDVRLVLAGTGSDLPRVQRFARDLAADEHIRFLGRYDDSAPLLHRAEVVWVPSLNGGGMCAALEGMAAGRPVVASRCADLAALVADGETGYLVEPDNKAALARQTRFLLDDAGLRQRMGEAGRQRVRECFSVDRLVEACSRRYAGKKS